jgi:hypothetical protein
LFPDVAGLDVNKADVKRYYGFVDRKVSDSLLVARHTSIANGRDKVELWDHPPNKGLQENICAFETLDT